MRPSLLVVALCSIASSACVVEGEVIDSGDGTYIVTRRAFAAQSGAASATSIAHRDAEKFCAAKDAGLHAIVIHVNASDSYEISHGGSSAFGGDLGGSISATGSANLRFRCEL